MDGKRIDDLNGFVRFLHTHSSMVYSVVYDVYMLGQIRKAKSRLLDNDVSDVSAEQNESVQKMDQEIERYKAHIESIANRIEREA